jgi:hypothetical protein
MLHLKSKVQRTFSHIAKYIYNYCVGYISNLAGKLKLIQDKSKRCSLYHSFKQDIFNLTKEEEEALYM